MIRSRTAGLDASADAAPTKTSGKATKANQSKRKKHQPLSSLFSCLNVEEPGQNPLGELGSPKSAAHDKHPTFRLAQLDDDPAFETWCFLQDLADIRKHVKQTWQDYARGDISFLAAGTITDTAFGLLREADERFAQSSPFASTDWSRLIEYLGLNVFVRGQSVWLHPRAGRDTKEPRLPGSDVDIVDLLCPLAFLCLQSWKIDAQALCDAVKSAKKTGKPISFASASQHHLHDVCAMLCRLTHTLHPLAHQADMESTLPDEFLHGLADIHLSSVTPMWMVVACEIYLDCHNLLESEMLNGATSLQDKHEVVKRLAQNVERYEEESRWDTARVQNTRKRLEYILKELERRIRASLTLVNKETGRLETPDEAHAANDPNLFRQFASGALPASTGTQLAAIETMLYDTGCDLARNLPFVLSCAHIYRALRATATLKTNWEDMEFAISSFGAKGSLAATEGKPFVATEAHGHYMLALGAGACTVSRYRKGAKPDGAFAMHARGIVVSSPLLRAFCDREDQAQRRPRQRTLATALHALAEKDAGSSGKGAHASPSRVSTTGTRLLDALKSRLQRDEPTLRFDYIGFTISCARLLEELASKFPAVAEPPGIERRDCYTSLTQQVLLAPGSSSLGQGAANLFRDHIEAEGKLFVKQAYDKSSGRIPKEQRPVIAASQEADLMRSGPLRTLLDETDVKYSLSGPTLAAYHPNVKAGNGDSRADDSGNFHLHKKNLAAQTRDDGGMTLTSLLPDSLMEEVMVRREKAPTAHFESRIKVLNYCIARYAADEMSDDDFRAWANVYTGFELIKLTVQDVDDGRVLYSNPSRTEWTLKVCPKDEFHATYLDVLLSSVRFWGNTWRAVFRYHWIPLPLKAYGAILGQVGGLLDMSPFFPDMERGAHAVFGECIDKMGITLTISVDDKASDDAAKAWLRRDVDAYMSALPQRPEQTSGEVSYMMPHGQDWGQE